MATLNLANYKATGQWTNLVATIGAAASVNVMIQNQDDNPVQVVSGGASAPTTTSGVLLQKYDSVTVNAAQIWVVGVDGSATVSVTTV